ncbi:DnaJ C-terminal domain-containing protein [cf. Phormidesmis sp. LEGE 11477]|uniref:DnaJ C-terminal domain-containing protein n=1 Tax=cf. Phormidesmis sp. LEGE 11477 TaxID=1828680 RepID=UPI0018818899|nr:J domain-containing protein [cf. Phormidesmis sp. LEGE 11477]MBE9061832.1 J domain-containing protein [cf. Phormidesmis sp. LEGE 11477]
MQNFRDYYQILGVSPDSSAEEIKRAYRALARQYHPDVNPGDKAAEEKFKLLGEAYEVLYDADKRQQYEQYSQYWNKGDRKGWGRKSKRSSKEADYSAFEDFDNFVEQLLKQQQASDQVVSRSVSRWPAAQPASKAASEENVASQTTSRSADTARSSQRQPARPPDNSSEPKRRSRPTYRRQAASSSRRDAEADLTVPIEKAYAGGRERVRLEDGRSLEVDMPPGMVTGQRLRLKGQGIEGGNLYLRIEVEPHSYFTLQDGDVYCRLPLTPSEAVLGGTIAMPTLGGPVNMMIPPGVQPRQRLRLTGKGYPIGQGLYGDQIVEIEVVMPTVLDDEEKALYQELRNIERFNPRADLPF